MDRQLKKLKCYVFKEVDSFVNLQISNGIKFPNTGAQRKQWLQGTEKLYYI